MRTHLPCGCVSPEVGEHSCKPVVDLIKSQLSVWSLKNGLEREREIIILVVERKVGERRGKYSGGGGGERRTEERKAEERR